MIRVSRLNDEPFLLNCDMIELVEETPNTVISLLSGRKLVVAESAEEIVRLTVEYKRRLYAQGPAQINR